MMEDWRKAPDDRKYVGAVLTDLSKAFDCMPRNLLLAKLKAYDVSNDTTTLMGSYLSSRVKLNSATSSLLEVQKGVPQGSILGPLLFNFSSFKHYCFRLIKLYTYFYQCG